MHAYHKPAAPAQVRQAHTLQGLVAATERAALTCRGFRAILMRLHRECSNAVALIGLSVCGKCRLKRACEIDMPRVDMPRVLKLILHLIRAELSIVGPYRRMQRYRYGIRHKALDETAACLQIACMGL